MPQYPSHNFCKKKKNDENYNSDFITHRNSNNNVPEISYNQNNVYYNLCLDMSELISTLQTCNSKSPGPDNVSYIFLKRLPALGIQTLLITYNIIWTQRLFPNQW